MNSILYLTFDTDWLCDDFLSDTIDLLNKYNVKATFFATNESQILRALPGDRFEIALHPNFDKGNGRYDVDELIKLKELYPNAIGTRSHTLFFGSRLLPVLDQCGIQYESNIFLYKHLGLKAAKRTKNIFSIPFNWSDDKHLEMEECFQPSSLPSLNNDGLNVFNFHPVHVFLNTENYARYERAKAFFNKKEMSGFVNKESFGVKYLLEALLLEVVERNMDTGLLRDVLGSRDNML